MIRLKPEAKEYWQSPVDKKGLWIAILMVSIVVGTLGYHTLVGGKIPEIGPEFAIATLVFLGVATIIGFIRLGTKVFSLSDTLHTVGYILFFSSFLLASGTPAKEPMNTVGALLMLSGMAIPYVQFGKRINAPEPRSS